MYRCFNRWRNENAYGYHRRTYIKYYKNITLMLLKNDNFTIILHLSDIYWHIKWIDLYFNYEIKISYGLEIVLEAVTREEGKNEWKKQKKK